MDAPTMIKRVADAAGTDRSRATHVLEGTLRVLGERLNGDEAEDLAAQLPPELTDGLLEQATVKPEAADFGRDGFVRRFAAAVSTDEDEAAILLQAAFEVLGDAVEPGEWGDVLAHLPSDMDPLFRKDRPSSHTG